MNLWQDVRYAARLLIKDKWFTVVAAAALALGIGVNNTVFTFVNAVLIRGLPFDEPDRILALGTRDPIRDRDMNLSYLDLTDWRASTRSFVGMAAFTGGLFIVSEEGRAPEQVQGPYISANGFTLLGQQPILGRNFAPVDDHRRDAGRVQVSLQRGHVDAARAGAGPRKAEAQLAQLRGVRAAGPGR